MLNHCSPAKCNDSFMNHELAFQALIDLFQLMAVGRTCMYQILCARVIMDLLSY